MYQSFDTSDFCRRDIDTKFTFPPAIHSSEGSRKSHKRSINFVVEKFSAMDNFLPAVWISRPQEKL